MLANITAHLETLIAFDTTSRNSNLELIGYVEGLLSDLGVASRLVKNDEGTKANLIATLGPNVAGGVVLSGHTDVVPVDGQTWATNPFQLHAKGDKLFGRGTADMKGFLAVVLAHVPSLLRANLSRPVHLAFSFDEEVGCLGIQSMLDPLKRFVAQPKLVVVGEPTGMQVANAHKGQYVSRTVVHGAAAHSSRPDDGVNAVEVATELMQFLFSLRDEQKTSGPFNDLFEPSYTTFNVGPISGGSMFNIIPDHCTFDWEYRLLPDGDGLSILNRYEAYIQDVINPKLAAQNAKCFAENSVWATLPPLKAEPGSDAEVLALALAEKNDTTVAAFGTEAGHFQSIEFPTVVCGPGDIAQAHKPDEFIETSDLMACSRFMDRLRESLT